MLPVYILGETDTQTEAGHEPKGGRYAPAGTCLSETIARLTLLRDIASVFIPTVGVLEDTLDRSIYP